MIVDLYLKKIDRVISVGLTPVDDKNVIDQADLKRLLDAGLSPAEFLAILDQDVEGIDFG